MVDVGQRLKDRHKVQLTEARALAVGIVGVEVHHQFVMRANQFRYRDRLGGHRQAIEDHAEPGRIHPRDQVGAFGV